MNFSSCFCQNTMPDTSCPIYFFVSHICKAAVTINSNCLSAGKAIKDIGITQWLKCILIYCLVLLLANNNIGFWIGGKQNIAHSTFVKFWNWYDISDWDISINTWWKPFLFWRDFFGYTVRYTLNGMEWYYGLSTPERHVLYFWKSFGRYSTVL